MFAGSRFCAHCGAEATREVLDQGKPLACPRCREPMQSLRLGATLVHECAACGGLWLDPASLQQLADAHEKSADVVSVLATRVSVPGAGGVSTTIEVVRYVPCPSCTKLMNRVNFAHSSGIVLDVCKNHGLWLDRGELQRLLQFIGAGGLAAARKRDEERLVDEQRRLTALAGMPYRSVDINIPGHTPWHGDQPAGDAHSTLLTFLLDAVRDYKP